MKCNRIKFDRLKAEFEILKMRSAYISAEKWLIEEAERSENAIHAAAGDVVFTTDNFGNVSNMTVKDHQINELKERLKQLEEQGHVLLEQEQYEALARLQHEYGRIYGILKRLRSSP